MNFIQRNPNDSQYEEFHHGEYEFWPTSGSTKGKSISIPAAVVSGLELIAAAAAAGLLALAVSAMYVTSAPRTITTDSAVINAEVYNNSSDDEITYSLSLNADPRLIYQEGTLDDDSDTLILQNLTGGTTYLLQYYDEENQEIGEFRFTTPGEQPEGGPPAPQAPQPEQPRNPQDPAVDPVDPTPEEQDPAEPETDPTVETEPEEEIVKPPVIIRPTPNTPGDDPDPAPRPTPAPDIPGEDPGTDTDPDPEPESPGVEEPDIMDVTFNNTDSGFGSYFDWNEVHTFHNIPTGYAISVIQTNPDPEVPGETIPVTNLETEYADGTLKVYVYGAAVPVNKTTTVTVTVSSSSGTVKSVSEITPPSMKGVNITAEKRDGGGYVFRIEADVSSTDAYGINDWKVEFNYGEPQSVTMTKTSEGKYTGSYTAADLTGSGEAYITVYATWYGRTQMKGQTVTYGP